MPVQEAVLPMTDPWPRRRERAQELVGRYPHAAEMLRLYEALAGPSADAFHLAQSCPSPLMGEGQGGGSSKFAQYIIEHSMPGIIDATVSAGPPTLRDGVVSLFATADLEALIGRWLAGEVLSPIETYLARASARPVLEAITISEAKTPSPSQGAGPPAHASGAQRAMRAFEASKGGGATCPRCGGLPQLSYFSYTGESLVSGPRYLVCSWCGWNWTFSRMTCAGCGESTGAKLPIYQEEERFPHLRVDGCASCHRYLLTVDLRRDTRAVPVVDEIAALPLDLYAREQGLTKITPNLMGN
jgi:FdhE protein